MRSEACSDWFSCCALWERSDFFKALGCGLKPVIGLQAVTICHGFDLFIESGAKLGSLRIYGYLVWHFILRQQFSC